MPPVTFHLTTILAREFCRCGYDICWMKESWKLDSFSSCISKFFNVFITSIKRKLRLQLILAILYFFSVRWCLTNGLSLCFNDLRWALCCVYWALTCHGPPAIGGGCAATGDIVLGSLTFSMFLGTFSWSDCSSNLDSVIFVFSFSDLKSDTAAGALLRIFLLSFNLTASVGGQFV